MSGAVESARLRGWLLSTLVHGVVLLGVLLVFQVRGEASRPENWRVNVVLPVTPEPVRAKEPEASRAAPPSPSSPQPARMASAPVPASITPERSSEVSPSTVAIPVSLPITEGATAPMPVEQAPSRPVTPVLAEAATPAPQRVADAQTLQRQWLAALTAKLREMRRYPPIARRLGQEGVVTLRVELSAKGDLRRAEVLDSSGFPLLDQAAARLIQEAAAALRGGWQLPEDSRLEIPIAYRLEG
ncbi:MAG: TonB family protein [Pseudomonadota bacterium]